MVTINSITQQAIKTTQTATRSTHGNHAIKTRQTATRSTHGNHAIYKRESCNQDKQQQDQQTGIMQSFGGGRSTIKSQSGRKKHTCFKSAERLERRCRLLIAFDRGSGENRRESWETRKDRSPLIETRDAWIWMSFSIAVERDTGETRESCERGEEVFALRGYLLQSDAATCDEGPAQKHLNGGRSA